jgi:hypothetical protein
MSPSPIPQGERRRHERLSPDRVKVRCASGELDELYSGVNFAKRVVNVGLGGVCIETTGRLRPDVTLSVEIKFEAISGALRSQAKIIWARTDKEGAAETHLCGLRFIGPEITAPVREYLEGGRASMIMTRRQIEYEELKTKSEARKAAAARKPWSKPKKTVAGILVLLFCYIALFGGLVTHGRREAPAGGGGIHYRYLSADSTSGPGEETFAKIFNPLYWAIRKAGVDLTYDQP